MKKGIVLLVLAIMIAGGGFAQEKYDGSFKNTITIPLGLIAGGVSYERAFDQNFSAGGEVSFSSTFFIYNTFSVDAFGRWYPWGKMFYAEMGLGFGSISITTISVGDSSSSGTDTIAGFLIKPNVGWKIDVGKPGKFILQPSLGYPLVIGEWTYKDGKKKSDSMGTISVSLGIGYIF